MEAVVAFHGYLLGFAVIGAWATITGWAVALRLLGYDDTPTFWRAVSIAQILLVVQFVAGAVLVAWWLLGSGRPPGANSGGGWFHGTFHLLYGIAVPVAVMITGHLYARRGDRDPHSVFALVGLTIFGLTARAFQVGAGI